MNSFKLEPTEWLVLVFNVVYVGAFSAYFLIIGNYEFLWYVATLVGLIGLVIVTRRTGAFTTGILWALSLWGFAHMAGGGLPVGDGVLYNHIVLPLANKGELSLLRFDQIVHFYGFAVTAWLLWHILQFHFEALRGTTTIYVYPALGSMGLGATNEVVEFAAVLLFSETNVGGYFNTALDLVFNFLGAVAAVVAIAALQRVNLRE